MNKEEKELKKYVDKYFDKYMCVSFDKFLENWEETNGLLKYFENKQNELQHKLDKAIEYIGLNDEDVKLYDIYDVNGIELYKILRGEE